MEVGGWKTCNWKDNVQGGSSLFLKKCMNKGRKLSPINQHGRSVGKICLSCEKRGRTGQQSLANPWTGEGKKPLKSAKSMLKQLLLGRQQYLRQKRCNSHLTGDKCPSKGMPLGRYVSGKQAIPKHHQSPQHNAAKPVVCRLMQVRDWSP